MLNSHRFFVSFLLYILNSLNEVMAPPQFWLMEDSSWSNYVEYLNTKSQQILRSENSYSQPQQVQNCQILLQGGHFTSY